MRCPYCRNEDSRVVDSRALNGVVKRRRQCLGCGQRFTTRERVEAAAIFVIKKDGRREEFNRAKLTAGIRKSCEKRPLATGAIDKLVDEVESEISGTGKAEVASSQIGEMVMKRLRELDQIAYIRFASVYRQFADIEDVRRELEALAGPAEPVGQLPLLPPERLAAPRGRRGRRYAPRSKVR
ncbi:MAG: transcriptional repressor NrdR [Chloroflexi bacterium]|nr:transcriptional repressor NrdR [Chloroflexota bacterium]